MTPAEPLESADAGEDAAVLSPVAQDYLKIVWNAQEWSDAPVTTKSLAERLGVGASTVSETVRRLTSQGLLSHARYGAITLTALGERHALHMVRRHRLIETFLVRELGYTWDEVHDEAEVLEHAMSDVLIERIDDRLGHPTRDPHGDPIPHVDGTCQTPTAQSLLDLPEGATGVVARISDVDPQVLRYLAQIGLGLDARIEVRHRRDYAGVIGISWQVPDNDEPDFGVSDRTQISDQRLGMNELELGMLAASTIWVELA